MEQIGLLFWVSVVCLAAVPLARCGVLRVLRVLTVLTVLGVLTVLREC